MNHSPDLEPKIASTGSQAHPTRRSLLAAGVSMALAGPLLSATARTRFASVSSPRNLTPMDALALMASSCDMANLLSLLRYLAITPVLAGNATAGAVSMNAALDALGEMLGAGLNTLAVPIAVESMGTDYYPSIVAVNAPMGQPMIDYMFDLGHPSDDAGLPMGIDLKAVFAARQTKIGIENLSVAQLDAIRQNLSTLIPLKPAICAGFVLGASASIGALTLPGAEIALGLATVGFMSTGASASLI